MDTILGLQHIGMPVNQIHATKEFYLKSGFSVASETMNGNEHVAFLRKGDLIIETYENHAASLRNGAWDHVALNVKDIHKAWEQVVEGLGIPSLENGIQVLPFWEKGVKFFTALGPNKEKIEFSQML